MSAAHRRAARREREAAAALGVRRIRRARYEGAPDVEPLTLPNGVVIQAEVKTRGRLPALVRNAIAQARQYAPPGAVPLAILSETGGEAVAVVPLRAFVQLVTAPDGSVLRKGP